MLKKIFFASFLIFSFFCATAETALQDLFFEASKYAATGISKNQNARALASVSQKNIKQFYSARIAVFDEKHHFVSLYIAEALAKNHIGEIDCLYDENDFESFSWKEFDYENNEEFFDKNEYDNSVEPENKKEFSYTDKSGSLRRFFYDGEEMSVNSYGGNIYITKTYGNGISRKCFDSDFRLLTEEKFSFGENPKNVFLTCLKTYIYGENPKKLSEMKEIRFPQKKPDKTNQKAGEIEIATKFNGAELASQVKTGHWEEISKDKTSGAKNQKSGKDNKSESELKFFDDKLETYLYDAQNRILEYSVESWSYKKNQLGKTSVQSVKTKYEYFYHDREESENNKTQDGSSAGNIPPDCKFYENGELRMERKYTASDDYTEKMIFPGGLYVETSYEDGVKKSETIYNNGKESRRRGF